MAGQIVQDDNCFCCGKQNSRGLKLEFSYPEKGKAETECIIPDYFTGWKRITHGGFLAMLLDETMAHACISEGVNGVTVDIQVRYLKPVEIGERIRISGRIGRVKSRIIETEAEVSNEAGVAVVRGTARFLQMQEQQLQAEQQERTQ
jgi:uncharacterized protein (TIGR00369 family)